MVRKVRMMVAAGLAVLALSIVAVPQAAAQPLAPPSQGGTFTGYLPLQMTGYNADVIMDSDVNVAWAQLFDAGCCGWFETGIIDANGNEHDDGIVAGSTFASMTGSGANYLIQPAVGANVLQVSSNVSTVPAAATLTLVTPAPYSSIAIFSSSGNSNGTAVGTVTINYADGSSLSGSYNTFDWCGGSNPLSVIPPNPNQTLGITSIGRVGSGLTATGSSTWAYGGGCGPLGFEAYETIIATDNTKNIVSFTFAAPTDSTNRSNVFGVSGQP
jgi:hypothetical protein